MTAKKDSKPKGTKPKASKPKASKPKVVRPKAKAVSKAPKKEKKVDHLQLILDKVRGAQEDIRNERKVLFGKDAKYKAAMLDRVSTALKEVYGYINKIK